MEQGLKLNELRGALVLTRRIPLMVSATSERLMANDT